MQLLIGSGTSAEKEECVFERKKEEVVKNNELERTVLGCWLWNCEVGSVFKDDIMTKVGCPRW